MTITNLKYQTIRDWEGKIKKITQKEYVLATGHGQYHPPEGCSVFQESSSTVAYFIGGARHKKPAHWNMADTMFRVSLEQLADGRSYSIESFDILKPSTSKSSAAPKLAFASSITIDAAPKKLLAFSVNGKCLDIRTPEMALSNEIHVYETVPPHSTYRVTTVRTPSRASQFPIYSKETEALQSGQVPPPMYGSTLTSLKLRNSAGVAVLVGGNKLANQTATPIQIMMGLKDILAEESSGGLFVLKFDIESSTFDWRKEDVEISPRAHHSTMLVDHLLYIFGGTNYSTNLRHDIRPVIIDTSSWTFISSVVAEDFPDKVLSGHSFLQIADNRCLLAGGYSTLQGTEKDVANDELLGITVDDGVVSAEVHTLGSGPLAQASFLFTPEPDVYILAGGIQERWALISSFIAPATPCDLQMKNKCLLILNPDHHPLDYVNWLGCDGPCRRWCHVPCLGLTAEDFEKAKKRRKWMCNRSDCK